MRNRVLGVVAAVLLVLVVALWARSRSTSEATKGKAGVAKTAGGTHGTRPSGRTGVIRSHKVGPGSEHPILDDSAQAVNARAAAVVARPRPLRDPKGDRIIPVEELFDDLLQFTDGLAQGRAALAAVKPDAPQFAELSKQVNTMHDALTRTRLGLLQEWTSEARSHLVMTQPEQKQFFAIINAQAATIATGKRPAPPSAREAPSAAIKTLLGPQRYAEYLARSKAFFPADVHSEEILP